MRTMNTATTATCAATENRIALLKRHLRVAQFASSLFWKRHQSDIENAGGSNFGHRLGDESVINRFVGLQITCLFLRVSKIAFNLGARSSVGIALSPMKSLRFFFTTRTNGSSVVDAPEAAVSGRSISIPCCIIGVVTMKMIKRTSITSTRGVTLISLMTILDLPPPLENDIGYSPLKKLRFAMFKKSEPKLLSSISNLRMSVM